MAAGAGGHAGTLSPFALIQEIREWFDGPIALSGAIAHGRAVLAAQAMGADFAYVGSRLHRHAARRARARAYKQMIVDAPAEDIVYTEPLHRRARQLPDALASCGRASTRPTCRNRDPSR